MKTTLHKSALSALLILSASYSAFSQCKEWVWPEDKAKAEECLVLIKDNIANGHHKQAVVPLNWILTNAPKLQTSIYINGTEVFDKLADQEKDPIRKQVYVDSLMIVYDMRIKNCGEEAAVLNRKVLSAFKYNANNSAKAAEILALFDKVFELNGNNVMDGTLYPYMQAVRQNKVKLKTITDEQILQRYDKIMEVSDAKIKKAQSEGKPIDKYKKIQEDVSAILPTIVPVDCKFVKTYLEPKFKQNPNDLSLSKKIFTFMLQGKCIDDPLWLEAGESIHRNTPVAERDCGLAKTLGKAYMSKDNFVKGEEYFKEAQGICKEGADKAEVLLYLGSIEAKNGSKGQARELFRQAASLDPSNAKEAFEKIGDMYYNSFNDCKELKNQADDRLVYLVAYDYYQRAGNSKKMVMAKESFPSKEEIFLVDYKVGQTKSVGCWVGESTTIRTRD